MTKGCYHVSSNIWWCGFTVVGSYDGENTKCGEHFDPLGGRNAQRRPCRFSFSLLSLKPGRFDTLQPGDLIMFVSESPRCFVLSVKERIECLPSHSPSKHEVSGWRSKEYALCSSSAPLQYSGTPAKFDIPSTEVSRTLIGKTSEICHSRVLLRIQYFTSSYRRKH